jgi:hypothetical protein
VRPSGRLVELLGIAEEDEGRGGTRDGDGVGERRLAGLVHDNVWTAPDMGKQA